MALKNNGKFRMTTINITKKVNGVLLNDGNFPKAYSILDAFGTFPAITLQDFEIMTDTDYQTRLDGFLTYLEGTHDFFLRNQIPNVAFGTNTILCPIE